MTIQVENIEIFGKQVSMIRGEAKLKSEDIHVFDQHIPIVVDGEVAIDYKNIPDAHQRTIKSASGIGGGQGFDIVVEGVTAKQLASIMIHLGAQDASYIAGNIIEDIIEAADDPAFDSVEELSDVEKALSAVAAEQKKKRARTHKTKES